MALEKGVNSYATAAEADAYFENRLDVAAWDAALTEQKEKALMTATQILDEQIWVGCVVSDTQDLAFPRIGYYFDPRIGYDVELESTVVPKRIITANFELAYHLLNNDGLMDDSGRVRSLQLGSIDLQNISQPDIIPTSVYRKIQPLLERGGSSWWRAN